MTQSGANKPPAKSHAGAAVGCIAIGIYLLAGSACAFAGAWPFFMPPLFDGIAELLYSMLPEPSGTHAAGVITGLLGIAFVAGGIALWTLPATKVDSDAQP